MSRALRLRREASHSQGEVSEGKIANDPTAGRVCDRKSMCQPFTVAWCQTRWNSISRHHCLKQASVDTLRQGDEVSPCNRCEMVFIVRTQEHGDLQVLSRSLQLPDDFSTASLLLPSTPIRTASEQGKRQGHLHRLNVYIPTHHSPMHLPRLLPHLASDECGAAQSPNYRHTSQQPYHAQCGASTTEARCGDKVA
jgi:hypothetical protein